MPDRPSRRAVLQAFAGVSTVALAGCASVVRSAGGGTDGQDASGETTPDGSQLNDTGAQSMSQEVTERSTDADRPDQTRTETETSWSIDEVDIKDPPTEFGAVPLPETETRYAQMGTADDVATVYGNWKCPYTREFVLDQLPSLIEEYVRPGELSIRFRSVAYRGGEPFLGADAPTATHAGIAVWETDPESFWNYFRYVFANQPQERYEWAKQPLLERFAERAGVSDHVHVAQSAADRAFTQRVQQTADSADRYDIWSVPRVEYDGDVTAPTVNPERTREQLE